MKKILVAVLLLSLCTGILSAQQTGIRFGLSLADAQYTITGASISTSQLTGFNAGVIGELPVSNSIFLNYGILYIQKGLKLDISGLEGKIPVDYLEIPVNLCYKYNLVVANLFEETGPYLGVGLSAKAKAAGETQKIDFGTDNDELKRLDFGINIGDGIEINFVRLGFNYGLGFIDPENDPDA
jgi:hypothetical protein